MNSRYDVVLEELRFKKEKLASEYITELYYILSEEEHLPPEECRAKIESDCSDIWSEETIRKYLPPEAKNKAKRKAGKISAEVKKLKKEKKGIPKEETERPPIVVNPSRNTSNQNRNGQLSALIDSPWGSDETNKAGEKNEMDNSVGINPTENCPVGQKKHESGAFQQGTESDDDYFSALLADRHNQEALEIMEDLSMLDEESAEKSLLLLPPELAEQIYIEVNANHTSDFLIPEFELEHNGTKIMSVRKVPQ